MLSDEILLFKKKKAFPSPGDLPDPGIEHWSPALQVDSLPSELPGKPPLKKQKFLKKIPPSMHRMITFLLIYGYILRKWSGNIFEGFKRDSLGSKIHEHFKCSSVFFCLYFPALNIYCFSNKKEPTKFIFNWKKENIWVKPHDPDGS